MSSGAGLGESAILIRRTTHSDATALGGSSANSFGSSISLRTKSTRKTSESFKAGFTCRS
ncbi:hypothetical protein BE221DRAFT_189425 [Ostreococcus tauri]|uniref:Uncharacterized protein n=1 Tax=Ostreococcus tauri TaxID=70448 RepID=A0A1Y5ILN3_OSTTA|nr:hypothetical protein BE221DRAFT_190676 [Ostreococcus tauri]OUS49043.1 hypothetical protein BE221DRAFT_189425 [Ostreococcus tauri]